MAAKMTLLAKPEVYGTYRQTDGPVRDHWSRQGARNIPLGADGLCLRQR